MDTKYVIYTITNLANGKKYVGQSKDHINRWGSHKVAFNNFLKGKKCANKYLAASVRKYGLHNFEFGVIFCCYGIDNANYMEMQFISEFGTFGEGGYNLTLGGGGTKGHVVSEATKSKYRDMFAGEGNPYFGKTHSKETKDRLSEYRSMPIVIGDKNYKSVLEASLKLEVSRAHIYNLVRDGLARFDGKESECKTLASIPKRKFRRDSATKSYSDYVYEYLKTVVSATTTEIVSGVGVLHLECIRIGIRELLNSGVVTVDKVRNAGGKHLINKVTLKSPKVLNPTNHL